MRSNSKQFEQVTKKGIEHLENADQISDKQHTTPKRKQWKLIEQTDYKN